MTDPIHSMLADAFAAKVRQYGLDACLLKANTATLVTFGKLCREVIADFERGGSIGPGWDYTLTLLMSRVLTVEFIPPLHPLDVNWGYRHNG